MSDVVRWNETSHIIKDMCDVNPYRTLQSIGNELGFTRERIRQIINRHNITYPDNLINRYRPDPKLYCPVCSKVTHKKTIMRNNMCGACKVESKRIQGVCMECGKHIHLTSKQSRAKRANARPKNVNINHIFCGVSCASKYVGKHYGFHTDYQERLKRLRENAP